MLSDKEKHHFLKFTTFRIILIKKRANAMTFALKGEMRMLLCSKILFPLLLKVNIILCNY